TLYAVTDNGPTLTVSPSKSARSTFTGSKLSPVKPPAPGARGCWLLCPSCRGCALPRSLRPSPRGAGLKLGIKTPGGDAAASFDEWNIGNAGHQCRSGLTFEI